MFNLTPTVLEMKHKNIDDDDKSRKEEREDNIYDFYKPSLIDWWW